MLPVVTRYLAVDEYGYYSLYISVVTFLSIFIGFGGDNYARLLTVKSPELYSEVKYILFIYFFLSLIIILGILVCALEFTNFIPLNDNEIVFAVFDSSLIFAINYKLCVLQSQRKVVKYCIVNLTRVVLYVIIIIPGFLFFEFKVYELIVTRLISCFIVVILFCLPAKIILK
jgi:O-antigen/teichoic acid export membrane protein